MEKINELSVYQLIVKAQNSFSSILRLNDYQIGLATQQCIDSLNAGGKIIFTGVGKNVYACHKLSATFASLNIPAQFFDVTHGLHGDLGLIKPNDIIICFSKSGSTFELTQTMQYIKNNNHVFRTKIIGIKIANNNNYADMHSYCDTIIDIPQSEELDAWNKVPTISALQLQLVGDIIALKIAESFDFSKESFIFTHPGGTIGQTNK